MFTRLNILPTPIIDQKPDDTKFYNLLLRDYTLSFQSLPRVYRPIRTNRIETGLPCIP